MKRTDRKERGITRRDFHGLGAVAVLAATAPWLAKSGSAETPQLASEIPENEPVLAGIQFVSESRKDGQQCKNCMLFQPAENGLGKCQIINKGLVPEQGWCVTWSAKP